MKTKLILTVTLLVSAVTFSQKQWSLQECVNHALQNNITIKQNRLNVLLAEKDVEIARGNFLPDLNAGSSGSFNFGSFIDGVSNSRISSDNFNANFRMSTTATIFNGFRNLNTYKQAKLGVEGSLLDLNVIENNTSLQVVNSYLNILFAKENLSVAKVQADISKTQIERAQAQFEEGAIPKGDLLNVQSTAANDSQAVITQENALNLALLNLAQLLQLPAENFDITQIEIESPSAALLYSSANEVYSKAVTNWPEIKRAELAIDNAEFNIELNKGAYLPTLSASAGANTGFSNRFNDLFTNDNFFKQVNNNLGYSIGMSLNVPIFNRFQTKNRVAKAVINKEQSQFSLQNEKLRLQQTIEQAYLDSKAAAKAYEAAQISLSAQEEAFKNAQVSYDYGSMTQFDFDQVRTRYVNAEGAMIRAKYDYVFKTKVLKFYFGESIVE